VPKSGYDLGVDLYKLWYAGRHDLPTLAEVYAKACNALADTDIGIESAFRRDVYFGPDRVLDAWRTLRDSLHGFLRDSATNLEMTADALCLAVSAYKETDDGARQALTQLLEDNGEPRHADVDTLR